MLRKLAWTVLITSGVGGVLWALMTSEPQTAVAVAIVSVFAWIFFAGALTHFLGIRRRILKHFGRGWRGPDAQVVTHPVSSNDQANVQIALDKLRLQRDPPTPLLGYPARSGNGDLVALLASNPQPAPLEWVRVPRSLTESIDCATNAVYLLHHKGAPYAVMVRPAGLAVMAQTRQLAQDALDEILALMNAMSVYRGSVVTLEKPGRRKDGYAIRFHELSEVHRSSIVLPEAVLEAVERNVIGLLTHARLLKRAGRGVRHGVLLHGPPGTGKTLVAKYLARACPGFTVILLTGRNLRFVRQSCQLARLLAPSMVVMEDVDLVAAERSRSSNTAVLHWLMDEMDGMGPKSETVFLLTTNRPEVLEPALAARPGRVDQAIYFPLPDHDCRRRLFEQYKEGLDLSAVAVDALLDRTEGASPAFIQELFRKAALMAAERGERSDPLKLTTADFDRAIREMVEFGGELTRNLLNFRARQPQT